MGHIPTAMTPCSPSSPSRVSPRPTNRGTRRSSASTSRSSSGEIFALLGPNGAGKTTLISIVCGIVNPTGGTVSVAGHDIVRDYRVTRAMIGLVPQELTTDAFETVWETVSFSRGLFGKPANPATWRRCSRTCRCGTSKDSKIMTLSGGMKRRVLIAKALAHEPQVLFLDEPTAGVDVELRKDMWEVVRTLRASGVTIILTTHYIEEAELMADRVGVINKGELILVETKTELMRKLGKKQLTIELQQKLDAVPAELAAQNLTLAATGMRWSTPTRRRASGAASRGCSRNCSASTSGCATSTPCRGRSRTSSSTW